MGKKEDENIAAILTFKEYLLARWQEIEERLIKHDKERETILAHKQRIKNMLEKTTTMLQ